MKRFVPLLLALTCALPAAGQDLDAKELEKDRAQFGKWDEAVKDHKDQEGFLQLFRKEKEERILAAIPRDLLEQPFFLATSVAGGSDYAGWQWQDTLVRFERFRKQVMLVELNTRQRAAQDNPLASVVRRTYADRLLATLDIIAVGEKGEVLVDLGRLLTSETRTFFGGLFSLDSSMVRFTKVKAFPKNIEVSLQMPLYGDGTFVTLHYSISALPELSDYRPRAADDRIGYFLSAIRDYTSGDPREGRMVRYINRWNLEKADPNLRLSPPREPIVFYVEKTVPIAYRRAVAEGILEWNKAFEQVGIVGAIDVRQQTETQFADLDPEDVRYNFFRWITSESAFAMGPSRVDPRNGRILDADIIFDDSMLRGYMRDYDTLLRDGPEKMLTRPMASVLERNPARHPMARFRAKDGEAAPGAQRMRRLLLQLAGDPALSKIITPGEWKVEDAGDLRELPRQLQSAAYCQVGEYLPHKVGLMRLALGGFAKEAGAGLPDDPTYSDYLAEIVKETVMHEVGHTLGLRHNFQASSLFDLDALNSKEKPAVLSASVMDYHPVNLVPTGSGQPRGHFLTRTLGPYDMLAIEYGYALVEKKTKKQREKKEDEDEEKKEEKEEELELNEREQAVLQAVARRIAEKGLPYATDEDMRSPDPSIAQWDLGDDPIKFATYRHKLVTDLWGVLEQRTVGDDESYSKLRRALDITLFEVSSSSMFVARQVGGLNFSRDHRGDPKARQPIRVVDSARQRASIQWLAKNVFAADAFPIPPELQAKLAAGRWVHWGSGDGSASLEYSLLDRILRIQTWTLFFLISDDVLARVWENEQRALASGAKDPLTLPELFETIELAIFSELSQNGEKTKPLEPFISSRRQNLQDAYVRQLMSIALATDLAPPVASKLAWARLQSLEERMAGLLARAKLDPYSKAHLEVLAAQSQAARTARYVHVASGVSGCSLGRGRSEAGLPLGALAALLLSLALLRRKPLA